MQRSSEKTKLRAHAVPPFLRSCSEKQQTKIIASGITMGFLEQCCLHGCVHCYFVGWKRLKHGTIFDINAIYYTTGQYAKLKDVSYKTIARMCDEGDLKFFKKPGSKYRFILDEDFQNENQS